MIDSVRFRKRERHGEKKNPQKSRRVKSIGFAKKPVKALITTDYMSYWKVSHPRK